MTSEEGVADAGRHVLTRWLLRAAETVTKPRGNIGTRRKGEWFKGVFQTRVTFPPIVCLVSLS